MVVGELIYDTDVLVMGGGPGGYTAAIHAADLGFDVMLVEKRESLGGVCLTEGCIPSKTLIHTVALSESLKNAESMGLVHQGLGFDIEKLREWVSKVVKDLSSGVSRLLKNRDIDVVRGHARFLEDHKVYVEGANTIIRFKHAIIATGSRINELPAGYNLPLWTSAKALTVPEIPESLLVVGGGYIGLEIGQVYAGLGSRITLVEFNPELLPGADRDLVNVVLKKCRKRFEAMHMGSKVTGVSQGKSGYRVDIETKDGTFSESFSQVLVAVGRRPNTDDLGLSHVGIEPDRQGLIITDEQCRTRRAHIFAIGDITSGPALAHKASREGKVAAEVIAGEPSAFDNVSVPAVLFTDPEIAWTGLTEQEAEARGQDVKIGRFPLTALGRAKSMGATEGFVKIIADPDSGLLLGMGIAGKHASELISEGNLALEMGATLEDLMVTIHPHPTFSESIMEAAEMAEKGSVHMMRR
jgi:dihydrolipoamide dehydrogenase